VVADYNNNSNRGNYSGASPACGTLSVEQKGNKKKMNTKRKEKNNKEKQTRDGLERKRIETQMEDTDERKKINERRANDADWSAID